MLFGDRGSVRRRGEDLPDPLRGLPRAARTGTDPDCQGRVSEAAGAVHHKAIVRHVEALFGGLTQGKRGAESPAQYLQRAINPANDVQCLSSLRAGMRQRLKTSPLLDSANFTRNLESAYRKMWMDWQNCH